MSGPTLDTRRYVPEWIGAKPDSAPPPRVRLRVYLAYDGRCHWSGRKIASGDAWDLDHIVALCNGGENRESNLAPILRGKPHAEKTANDVAMKAKADRLRKKHLGIGPDPACPVLRTKKWKRKVGGQTVLRNSS